MESTYPAHCVPERYHAIAITKLLYYTNTAY